MAKASPLLLVLTLAAGTAAHQGAQCETSLRGRWVGDLGTPDGVRAELRLEASGTAHWHRLPDGAWTDGEWERETRIITFTWAGADTSPWVGHYDVEGNALLFDHTIPGSHTTIFQRVFR